MAPIPKPIALDAAARAPTWRAAYSDRTAALMAAMAEYAYEPPDVIDLLAAPSGLRVVGSFDAYGLFAALLVAPGQMAVLEFRGTDCLADWGLDLDAARVAMPGHPHVHVHAGFWSAWRSMAPAVEALLAAHVPPDLGLYITGHSLGGALAQLAAMELARDTLAGVYTFGSPRVATEGFDEAVKAPHYRVVNAWDLVPSVPPAFPGGFAHAGDPRLLVGETPTAALRRDRGLLARTLADAWSLAVWPATHDLTSVDDHMIWNYRRKLDGIATARNP